MRRVSRRSTNYTLYGSTQNTMSQNTTAQRYSLASIGLHWLMVLLIIAVYACIELRELYPKGSDPREALKQWHFMLGLSVFALMWLRLLARFIGPTPPIEPAPPKWQELGAKLAHLALYGMMLGLPLVGWLILSAEGKAIPFFGMELPALVGPNHELAENLEELHEVVGKIGYLLIGVHAAAAIVHHHLMGDNTLRRMLPGRG